MSGKKEVSIRTPLAESNPADKSPPGILKVVSSPRQQYRHPLCQVNSLLDGRMYATNYEGCGGDELTQFACTLLGDKLYFFGGCNKGGVAVNTICVFDITKRKWYSPDQIGAVMSRRRAPSAIAIDDRRILVHGGYDGTSYFKDAGIALAAEFEASSYPIVRWEKVSMSGDVPSRRCAHSTAILDRYLYLFGGTNKVDYFSHLHSMKLSDFSWKVIKATGSPPPGRINAALITAGSMIYCFGGYGKHCFYRDMHSFDPSNNTWTKIADSPSTPNARKPMGLYEETTKCIYFFLGGPGIMSTSYSFDTTTSTWNSPTNLLEYSLDLQAIAPPVPIGQTGGILIDFGGDVPMDKLSILQLQKSTMNPAYKLKKSLTDTSILKYFDDSETSDITVEVEQRQIKVHRIVLMAASNYFRKFFQDKADDATNKIGITECSYAACYDALKYIYNGTLSRDCSFEFLLDLFSFSIRYEISSLFKACEEILKHKLKPGNVCGYLLSINSNMSYGDHVKRLCFDFIKREQRHGNMIDMSSLKEKPELLVDVINYAGSVSA